MFVEKGSTYADLGFVCTSDTGGTLNTTAITYQQFTGAGQITAGNDQVGRLAVDQPGERTGDLRALAFSHMEIRHVNEERGHCDGRL